MESAAILVVEDEAISALYIKNTLLRLQYRVVDIVASGENAVAKAEALHPDLILMDIRLAGEMDGITAAKIIHQNCDIPVVFLTAHMDDDSMQRAMATEPAGYVPKPTSERELRGTIEMALKNEMLKKQLRASEARYHRIFNTASVSISELDFSRVKLFLDDLRREGISDLKAYLQLHPDILSRLINCVRVLNANDWNLQLFEAPNLKTLLRAYKQSIKTEGMEIFRELLQAIWEGAPYYEGEGILQTLAKEKKYVNINVAFLTGGIDLSRVLMVVTDITQRKQMEKALAESEARYRQIVETTQEGIWILDKNFKMVFANRRIAEMLGYLHEELMGMDVDDLVFDEDMPDHRKRREARRRGVSDQYERQFRRKDGKPLWVNVTATPLLDEQGELQEIIAMITDISQRKEAEQIFERQQAHTRTMDALSQELSKLNLDFKATLQTAAKRIIELSGDICIIRLVTDDGLYVQPIVVQLPKAGKKLMSDRLMTAHRVSVDEGLFSLLKKSGRSLLVSIESTPELISLISEKYRALMQKVNITNGMIIPLRSQGVIIGDIILGRKNDKVPYNEDDLVFYQEVADRICLIITDARMYSKVQNELEERRAAEAALRVSEKKYRDLFDLSPDSIILISPDGIILDCNLATSRLTGLSKEEMVGKLFYHVVTLPVEKYPEYTALFNNVMTEAQTDTFEIEITQLHGRRLDIEVFPKIIWKDEVITGVLVILRDITDRKLSDQKIKETLIEKETLLSELNHRVKNNLASIVSILDLQKVYISDNQLVDLITELQERIRLMALIHEQLYRSRNLSRIDFAKYLEDLSANLMRALLRGRDIQLDIHSDSAQLGIAVAIPCGQIVTELVTNALKYAFPAAQSTRWEEIPSKIEVSFKTLDNQCILKVSDNGVGFPPDLDFYHAETLGMQLVMLLTNQLDGVLEVNGDAGVSVSITFPCSDVG